MKTATTEVKNLLAAGGAGFFAEIFTITLLDATVKRYTSLDVDVAYGGNTFSATGLKVDRSKIRQVRGLEVDGVTLTVAPGSDTFGGLSFLAAVRSGAFLGAWVLCQRVFFTSFTAAAMAAPVGIITLFNGRWSDTPTLGRGGCQANIKSILELFNIPWPKHTYQAGCAWQLYSAGCGLAKATFYSAEMTVAATGSTTTSVKSADLHGVAASYKGGVLFFTSGALDGVQRTVQSGSDVDGTYGQITVTPPLTAAPAAGVTFKVYPGCDKTLTTCTNVFSNQANFRGFPFVPVPETTI